VPFFSVGPVQRPGEGRGFGRGGDLIQEKQKKMMMGR
jgi:hypothetical protein